MKDQTLFSIITVVYNDVDKIELTLNSVIAQSFKQKELIVVDGDSNDGTLEIIRKKKKNIHHVISEKDEGIYHAMNKGVALAEGRYCLFMNSGDTFVDDHVLDRVAQCIEDSDDIVYGDVMNLNAAGEASLKKSEVPGNKHRMFFCHQSSFARTSLLQKFKFDEAYKMSADFKFIKQCYLGAYKFHQLSFPVANFDTSGVSRTKRVEGMKENIEVIKEVDRGFEKIRILMRLMPSYLIQKIRNKKR